VCSIELVGCFLTFHLQVKLLYLGSCPRCFSQELEARFDARVEKKTPDRDAPTEFCPTMLCHQLRKQTLKRDAVQRIVGFRLVHECILVRNSAGSIADCDSFGCGEFAGHENNVEIRLLRAQSADRFIFAQQPQIKIKWPSPKTQRSKPRRHRQKRQSKRRRRSRSRNRAKSKKPLLHTGSTSFEPYSTARRCAVFVYGAGFNPRNLVAPE
jgi:hypothetical protein